MTYGVILFTQFVCDDDVYSHIQLRVLQQRLARLLGLERMKMRFSFQMIILDRWRTMDTFNSKYDLRNTDHRF